MVIYLIAEGKKPRQRGISAPLHSPKGGLTLAAPFICSAAVRGEANTRRAVGPRGYVLWTTVQLLVLVKLLDKAQFNNIFLNEAIVQSRTTERNSHFLRSESRTERSPMCMRGRVSAARGRC